MNLHVIEGFYGNTWAHYDRQAMLLFMAEQGFHSYIYAPKADIYLRNQWQSDWPQHQFEQLQSLSQQAKAQNLGFGLGLSPISLMDDWGKPAQQQLKKRLQQISALNPAVLAVLFDDIQGDKSHLAQVQIEISHFVQSCLPDIELWVCPTYYTFDPILPELFGQMPDNYWQDLGRGLDSKINLLWTGDKVISQDYSAAGLEAITTAFQRKPIIWDNSRVNDGRKTSPFIPIKPMFDFAQLTGHAKGALINPINQAHWAMLNLFSIKQQGDESQRLEQSLAYLCPELKNLVIESLELFRCVGLEQLTSKQKQLLKNSLEPYDSAFAQELKRWLEAYYRFDPTCLT